MARIVLRFALAATLVLTGWLAGTAQMRDPDFEIAVETRIGANRTDTTIKCVRGCSLSWVERGVNPRAAAAPEFRFGCTGQAACSSARVGGWLQR